MAGLISKIKSDVKKSGSNKSKFVFVREGEKRRFRFLTDADDGEEIVFHDNFNTGVVPTPCQEIFGRSCPYCDVEGIRTRSQYAWSVWDYETNDVRVFMFPVNNCSPVPHLINMYETYGTLTDRDYVISTTGKQQNKTYSVVPMDKVKFRNTKAKSYSRSQLLKMLDKAFPCDGEESADDTELDSNTEIQRYSDSDDELPSKKELERMTPVKLYNLCKELDIDVKSRGSVEYYVEELEQWRWDNINLDDYDGDQDRGDDEAESDYSSMSPKELYNMCGERGIKVQPKKSAKYYISQLDEYDRAHDDWEDSDTDEWEEE